MPGIPLSTQPRRYLYRFLLILLSVFLPACGSTHPSGSVTQAAQRNLTPASPSSDAIRSHGAGATFPLPIYTQWMYAYSLIDPTVEIDYEGTGSGAGKKAIMADAVVVIHHVKPGWGDPADMALPAPVPDGSGDVTCNSQRVME